MQFTLSVGFRQGGKLCRAAPRAADDQEAGQVLHRKFPDSGTRNDVTVTIVQIVTARKCLGSEVG